MVSGVSILFSLLIYLFNPNLFDYTSFFLLFNNLLHLIKLILFATGLFDYKW